MSIGLTRNSLCLGGRPETLAEVRARAARLRPGARILPGAEREGKELAGCGVVVGFEHFSQWLLIVITTNLIISCFFTC